MITQRKTPNGFSSSSRFDIEAFSSPALSYAPVYTWMWNGKVTAEDTDREIEEMARLGIKRIYILPMPKSFRPTSFPTPLEPEYLSKDYLSAYRYALEKAREKGMEVWLYDEGGWPSGGACGQVTLEDPTLVQESIRTVDREVKPNDVYTPTEHAEAAFINNKRVYPNERIEESGTLTEYIHTATSFPAVNSADLPDITKEKAAPLFIALTHDKYAGALGEDLGGVTALFTDEPTAPRPFPYNEEIKALFSARFHRDIRDCLPFLTGREKCSAENATIKIEFYKMLSDLFIERFLKREKAWAEAHGVTFTGHLDKDDEANASVTSGCFGILPALRVFDVPGVDAIRRQIFPPRGRKRRCVENGFFPILAASAAAQTGGRHALSENFAVYGAGLSYDEMKYIVNYQAMCGINVFNSMLVPYARKGYALAGELPHFTEKTYPDLAAFNAYLERLSYLFSLGERVAKVALFLPAADGIVEGAECAALSSYKSLGRELQERHLPFDIVDDDFFSFATVSSNEISSGLAHYDSVVLPAATYLTDKTIAALNDFAAKGGKVYTAFKPLLKRVTGAIPLSQLPDASLPIKQDCILLAHSKLQNGELWFLMNEGENKEFIPVADFGKGYVISPALATATRMQGGVIDIQPGEIICLWNTDEELPLTELPFLDKYLIPSDWSIRPVKRLVIENEAHFEEIHAEFTPIRLGDWKCVLGERFSGTAEYRANFSLTEKATAAVLDLGKAAQVAEAFLNGASLGKRVMAPYSFDVPASLLQENNTLVVRVTNGAANEFEGTDAFDKYYPWQLGNYLKEERVFHADSKESGLFGEVKLYYK